MRLRKIQHKILLLVMLILIVALGVALMVIRVSVANQAKERMMQDLDAQYELISILIKSEEESLRKQVILLSEEPTLKMSLQTADTNTVRDTSRQLQQMIRANLFVITDTNGRNISQLPEAKHPYPTEGLSGVTDALMGSTAVDLWFFNSTLYLSATQAISFHENIEGSVSSSLRLDHQFAHSLAEKTQTLVSFLYHGQKVTRPLKQPSKGQWIGKTYQIPVGNSHFEVLLQVDYSKVLSDLNRISIHLLSLGLGVLALSFLLSQVLSKSLTRPIDTLKEGVLKVSQGDWEQPLGTSKSSDELGILHGSFEEMRKSLLKQREELLETEAIRQDLELAAKIQRSLLPSDLPEIPGISIGARLTPSSHIGGDYYGFSQFKHSQPGVAIADVAGHGAGSALLMAMARSTLLSQAGFHQDTGSLVDTLNRILYPDLEEAESFLTLFICSIDREKKIIEYTNAGHNLPVLIRSNGEIEKLDSPGTAIGFLEDGGYESKTVSFGEDDLLVLYTDGLIEPIGKDGNQYGMVRFIEQIRRTREKGIEKSLDLLYEDVENYCGREQASQDDRTCVIIHFRG